MPASKMSKQSAAILLRAKGSKTVTPFDAEHAKRLLAYPNTQWEEVAEEDAAKPAAVKKTPVAPAQPATDPTGHPTTV